MRRPLCLHVLPWLLAVAVFAEPGAPPDAPEGRVSSPDALRKRVCRDGAYLRGPAAAAASLGESARPPEGSEPAAEGPALLRFTPPAEGCEEAMDAFFSGPGAGFEIAPAREGARELTPAEASARMVSLSSLGRVLSTAGEDPAAAIERFFENKLSRLDVIRMSAHDALSGRAQTPGTRSYFVSDGRPRETFEYTATPRKVGLSDPSAVPDPRAPAPFQPARSQWAPPPSARPRDRDATLSDRVRGNVNDYWSQLRDWAGGSPIAREEGRPILPPAAPSYPGGDASVQSELLDAVGLRRRCKGRERCWGTARMATVLTAAGGDYARYVPQAPPMLVGDISKRGGGPISGHVSHQRGLDVDIMFTGGPGGFDVRTHTMILAGIARHSAASGPGSLQYILVDSSKHAALRWGLQKMVGEGVLDAPAAQRASAAIRHWPNHNDHFHVRLH